MHMLGRVLRFAFGLVAAGATLVAVLGFLGFAVPYFDLLNHFQLLIFAGTLLSLVLVPLVFPIGRWQSLLIALTATGFIASAVTVIPETIAALAARPPLPVDRRPVIKLMTHNVFGKNYDMQRVAEAVFAEDPDIFAVQEYFPEQRTRLHRLLKARYPFSVFCAGGKRANIALYAKFPFEQQTIGACDANAARGQRTALILASFTLSEGARFSVMTTHLDWPAPITRQRQEFEALAKAVLETKGALILVGDFNSTPWSYALRRFSAGAGLERQTHNTLTYPLLFNLRGWRETLPFLPLDHVMTRDLLVHELHAGERTGSDHLPVVATFTVAEPASADTPITAAAE